MKKILLIVLIIGVLASGFWLVSKYLKKPDLTDQTSKCAVKEITFYHLKNCEWCNKVKSEGTIEKIEQLGIKVNKIDAAVGPIRHKFEGVPTFIINDQVYTGYKTFEELKGLLNCPTNESPSNNELPPIAELPKPDINFTGDKGKEVVLTDGEIKLDTPTDNQAQFYNVKMPASPVGGPDGKIIYFFVVKDKNGVYRAAANACAVCFKTYKGFRQEGNEIVCNNCGNRYPIEKIATEKGGCNPGPINPNLEVRNGKIIIKQVDIEQVANLF
ncbi:MAG: Fe-S-containing protein [bacterium]